MGMTGRGRTSQAVSINKLFDKNTLERIAESAWNRIWDKFVSFGPVSAGILTISIILRILKSIIDIVLQGYALQAILGWSIHVLRAVFGSVTQLLILLAKQEERKQENDEVQTETRKTEDTISTIRANPFENNVPTTSGNSPTIPRAGSPSPSGRSNHFANYHYINIDPHQPRTGNSNGANTL
ncbi:hypothetical protein QAD02_021607 [Eretmocerus hayati]|uniref:Uncharacterized protein n=1 Tax=Eretmocerus hayati TaxID=131215 RepID=A0ACC2PR70_9HYME|nr:hypothetical protein QAD02_021607 [Eretmocerus hayati]